MDGWWTGGRIWPDPRDHFSARIPGKCARPSAGIDRDDLAVRDRESHHREQPPAIQYNNSSGAIYERGTEDRERPYRREGGTRNLGHSTANERSRTVASWYLRPQSRRLAGACARA